MTPEKTIRNKRIYKQYKRGGKGYKKLGKEWGLHYTTIYNIIKRWKTREKVG